MSDSTKPHPDEIRQQAEILLRRARASGDLQEKAELTEAALRLLEECPHGHTPPEALNKRMRTKGADT